jgi:hypothetical protein
MATFAPMGDGEAWSGDFSPAPRSKSSLEGLGICSSIAHLLFTAIGGSMLLDYPPVVPGALDELHLADGSGGPGRAWLAVVYDDRHVDLGR